MRREEGTCSWGKGAGEREQDLPFQWKVGLMELLFMWRHPLPFCDTCGLDGGGPHSGQNSQRQILASGGSSARVDPLTSGGKWTSLGEWLRTPWSQLWSWREPGDITASRVKAAFVKICNSNDFQLVPSQIPTWALPYWPGTCLAGSPPGSPRRSHLRAQDSADHRQKPPAPQNYTPNSHHTGRAAETKRKQ